jgi:hypothetical protein
VDVSINAQAVTPTDCTAEPDPGNPTSATLPTSAAVTVDEIWWLHCTAPSTHSFSFNNSISLTTPGISDPDPDNNSASTQLALDVIAQAYVGIGDQFLVNPPAQIDASTDVPVTLRKIIENNGSYGPVNVSIDAQVEAPFDCTATPSPSNPTAVTVPYFSNVQVDEVWTLHCTEPSNHVFLFSNAIANERSHVQGPRTPRPGTRNLRWTSSPTPT